MCFECLVIVEGVEDGEAILHVFWGAGAGLAPALSPGAGHGGWHRTRLSASEHRESRKNNKNKNLCFVCNSNILHLQIFKNFSTYHLM